MNENKNYELYRKARNLTKKLAKERGNIEFLKDCKEYEITPKFLKIHNYFLNFEYKNDIINFERRMLNKVIRRKYSIVKRMEQTLKELEQEIYNKCEKEIQREIFEKIEWFKQKVIKIQVRNHTKKLKFWIRKYNIEYENKKEKIEIPYINMSKFKPSATQDQLLKLGPKFIIEQPINLKDTIAKIEAAIDIMPAQMKMECRLKASKELERKIKKNNNNKYELNELKNLKDNERISIIETDKTGRIAILDKEHYNTLMEQAIEKLNVEEIKQDPINKLIKKTNELIKNKNWPGGKFPEKVHAPNTPRLFGKLKDHKDPVTIRPIVSKIESPTYKIEKYMKNVYQELLPPSNNSIKSTYEVINNIKDLELNEDEILVSLDIVNMYPSIDIKEISNIIKEELENKFKENNNTKNILMSSTNLLLDSAYFQFNGTYYKQKNGLPMGSPISGVLAELKIRILEKIILNDLKKNIILWIRYVDDVLAIIKGIKPNILLEKLNQYDNYLKFTLEIEENRKINYLDITLRRNETGKIDTYVYRKPSANNNILNFKSNTPYRYKKSAIVAYVNRALNICSTENLLNEEIENIKKLALKAGYKRNLIEKIITLRKRKFNQIPNAQKQKPTFTTSIQDNKGIGDKIRNIASNYGVNIPIKPDKNIFQLISTNKDKINSKETAGIYQINYTDNTNVKGCYIGVTERKIRTRVAEHKSDIEHNREKAAITKLENIKKYKIDYENPIKLANFINHKYAYKRETIEILANQSSCNRIEHSYLPSVWKNWFSGKGGKCKSELKISDTPEDDVELDVES